MKNLTVILLLTSVFSVFLAKAQSLCDTITEVLLENLDGYSEGKLSEQSESWSTFSGTEGGEEDGEVASLIVKSEPNSLAFGDAYGSSSQNVLLKLGQLDSGIVLVEFSIYVVPFFSAQFGGQHLSEDPSAEEAFRVVLGTDGVGQLFNGSSEDILFNYDQEEWLDAKLTIDLDNDFVNFFIDRDFIAGWPISNNSDGSPGTRAFSSLNFATMTLEDLYFVDDVNISITPSAVAGKFCHLATNIEVGTHSIGTLECYGAGFTVRDDGQGRKGEWYSYTAPSDGIITIGSCNGGGDTRVWIFSGGCENLIVEGVNDDQCLIAEGSDDDYASYREVVVKANETYLIMWDDVWESGNFTFELSFSDAELVAGNFCESAITIEDGQITIESINGHGAVTGPDINHTSASTTNYAKSEWYTFTPPTDGLINIATCFLTDEDTRLWIYKGDCGIESLELLAFDDDGCELQSIVADLPVEADVQYYFEWDNESLEAPGFDFLFEFDVESSTNSLIKPIQEITLSPNPTSGFATLEMDFGVSTLVKVEVFDHVGRLCKSIPLGKFAKYSYEINLENNTPGLYFVKINSENYSTVMKLIVN